MTVTPHRPPTAVRLADVVDASRAVAATRSRRDKTAILAGLLTHAREAGDDAVRIVAHYLSGTIPQAGSAWGTRRSRPFPRPRRSRR